MALSYDRRSPELLLRALEPGGFAHGLVQYGRSGMFGLDFQLRGRHGTLYVGTTKALDIHVGRDGRFRLETHSTYAGIPRLQWQEAWAEAQTEAWFDLDRWEAVEAYLDRVIAFVTENGSHLQEGIVQAALSRFPGNRITIVDREAVVSYGNAAEKADSLAATSRPWLAATERQDPPAWWNGSRPTRVSTECDLLGITDGGQLVTIEVKPGSASASDIAWAPLQARQYANQFQAWLDEQGAGCAEVLREVLEQQVRIGIRPAGPWPALDPGLQVLPMVAIDSRAGRTGLTRLDEVVSHLSWALQDPQVYVVFTNLVGRLLSRH